MRKRRVGVTARSRQNVGNQATGTPQFVTEMAAPLELRTPAGTCGPTAANRVRMEAWRQWRGEVNEQKNNPRSVCQGKERERGSRARYARLRRCLMLRQGASPLGPPMISLDTGWPSHGSRDRQGAVAAHAATVRGTRTRSWAHPARRRHTAWPPRRALVSTAIVCCHGVPIACASVRLISSRSDGGWRKL
jgi:hypothetical protein